MPLKGETDATAPPVWTPLLAAAADSPSKSQRALSLCAAFRPLLLRVQPGLLISKLARIAYAELELSAVVVELVVMERDAIVKPQRPHRQREANSHAPIVGETRNIEIVGSEADASDVVKRRNSEARHDRNAVLSR